MAKYNLSAILFSRNTYDYLLSIRQMCMKNQINLIYERDFYSFLRKANKILPNYIIIDSSTVNVSKFPFDSLKNEIFKDRIKIMILSDNFICTNKYIKILSLQELESCFANNIYKDVDVEPNIFQVDFGNKINNLLLKLGFSPNLKGKDYLKFCINLIINDGVHFRCLSKDCYPILALNYHTEISNIERDIRNAIKTSFIKNNIKVWCEILNCNLDKIPSNKQFIYLCVDKIKQDYIN
ncbi:MAG: hypothetical protein E7359_01090 [Clostridiales bacterium]|nr:hypothetical protein [Clostridiales bacterium]